MNQGADLRVIEGRGRIVAFCFPRGRQAAVDLGRWIAETVDDAAMLVDAMAVDTILVDVPRGSKLLSHLELRRFQTNATADADDALALLAPADTAAPFRCTSFCRRRLRVVG